MGSLILALPGAAGAQTGSQANAQANAMTAEQVRQLRAALEEQQRKAAEQERLLAEQARRLSEQQQQLEAQRRNLDALGTRLGQPPATRPAANRPSPPPPSGAATGMASGSPAPTPAATMSPRPPATAQAATVPAPSGEIGQRPPASASAVDAIIDQGRGVLTPRGQLVFEPGLEYSYADQNRILIEGLTLIPAIAVGSIDVRRVQRKTLTASGNLRYGLTDRLEVEAKVPFVYRADTTTMRNLVVPEPEDSTNSVTGAGLGDVEVAGHYQLTDGSGGWPFLIANLRLKTATGKAPYDVPVDPQTRLERDLPTGTGFYSLQPSITALFASDPVVFFTNLSYTWNIGRNVRLQNGTEVDINPGDAIGLSFGMGFSLNERASFSLGYEHSFSFTTEQDGVTTKGSDLQSGSLQLGYSYRINDKVSLSLQAAVGVTDAAPDIRLIARVPIRFNLF